MKVIEKLKSIMDVNNSSDNVDVTKKVLYKLMYQRVITSEEYNDMIEILKNSNKVNYNNYSSPLR